MTRPENGCLARINNQFEQSLNILFFLNGQMLYNPGVENLLEIYPERLTAVIAAKGDSNMY